MIIKKLKIKNIRSYREFEIEFPLGSTLLSGDIGSGKTSVLLALQFALFGLQPGQKGASLLRNGETEAFVSLDLEIDEKQINLQRTIKKTKSGISQDSNIMTIDSITQEISASEMKNKVIELLAYPPEFAKKSNLLYKFTVYTPQESMKEIIEENADTRLDTLRHIFGIDRYKRIKENTDIFLQKIKESVKIKEVEIREINSLKEKLALETDKKIKLAKEITNLKIDLQLSQEKNKAQQDLLKTFENKIKEKNLLDSELAKKQIELRGKNEIRLRFEKEIILMKRQLQPIDFSSEKLQEASILLDKHKQAVEELNEKLISANSRISVLNSKKEQAFHLKEKISRLDQCPTCMQAVSADYKDLIAKKSQYEIDEINHEVEPKVFEKSQLLKEIEKEKELIRGYESDKRELEQAKIKFQHQKEIEIKIKNDSIILERTMAEVLEIQNKISEISSQVPKFAEIEKKYESASKELDEISRKTRLLEISLAQKSREVELLSEQLQGINEEILKKEKIKEQLNYLRELQDWLQEKFLQIITAIETNVLAALRTEFSKLFNEWFTMLVSDDLSVRLDETFTPIISNQDYEIDYDFLSGGERTAVALAYRLALNQILNSMLSKIKTRDIIILDEPTDGFSAPQLDKMRDIFEQLNSRQTLIVSHEQKVEGFVDHVIKIKKEGKSMLV